MNKLALEQVLLQVQRDGDWSIIDGTGNQIVPFDTRYTQGGIDYYYTCENYQISIFDRRGRFCFSVPSVDSYSEISNGLLVVESDTGQVKVIDVVAGRCIDTPFDFCSDFKNGLAIAQVNTLYGVVDKNCQFIVKPVFEKLSGIEYVSGKLVGTLNNCWESVDLWGSDHRRFECASVVYPAHGHLIVSDRDNSLYGIADPMGEWIVHPRYEVVSDCFGLDNIAVQERGRWKLIDYLGGTIFETNATALQSLRCGFAAGYFGGIFSNDGLEGGKYRFLDRNGNFAFDREWYETFGFKNGVATVVGSLSESTNSYPTGYIDTSGRVIWEPSS